MPDTSVQALCFHVNQHSDLPQYAKVENKTPFYRNETAEKFSQSAFQS